MVVYPGKKNEFYPLLQKGTVSMMMQTKIKHIVYVLCLGISTLCAQEPDTVIYTIGNDNFQAGAQLFFIAIITPDGTTAYVPDANNNAVYIIRTADFIVTGSVSDPNALLASPLFIAITPNGTQAYIANGNDTIAVLDITNDNTITYSVTDNGAFPLSGPIGIAFTLNGATAYIANHDNDSVSIVDVTTHRVTGTVNDSASAFSGPGFVAILDAAQAYVTNNTTISVVDLTTNVVTGTVGGFIERGLGNIAITPTGTTAYVANDDMVNIIDTQHNIVTGTVSNSLTPFDRADFIATTPNGTTAYVSNTILGKPVSIIDLITNRVSSEINTGSGPFGLAITPDGAQVWVVNAADNTISIIGVAPISSPTQVQGCKAQNAFFTQTDFINKLTWQPPAIGAAAIYNIYRDAGLTQLAGSLPATANPLEWLDHNRNPKTTYTYYIVAVDASGNSSPAAVITVTQACSRK